MLYNKNFKLESFISIMKKAIVAIAKTNLRLGAIIQNIDQSCPWGFRLAYISTV